jgi:hypothetical protein
MFIESVRKAIANLFEIEVTKGRSNLLGVKTLTSDPELVSLLLIEQRTMWSLHDFFNTTLLLCLNIWSQSKLFRHRTLHVFYCLR